MGLVGQGAFLNDRPIHPSGVAELGLALLVTGFPYLRVQQHDNLPEFAPSCGLRRACAVWDRQRLTCVSSPVAGP